MRKCWIVFQGRYYTDIKFINSIFYTKKEAVKHCRDDGYKFNKSQELFLNDKCQFYRSLKCHEITLKELTPNTPYSKEG